MRGGLGDLLLDPHSFSSQSRPWGFLDLREHHSLRQLFDGVNSLVGFFHYTFKLHLSTCHLGKINLCLFTHLLFPWSLG